MFNDTTGSGAGRSRAAEAADESATESPGSPDSPDSPDSRDSPSGSVKDSGYWYSGSEHAPSSVDVLNLLRRYRESERRMRSRTRDSMSMGETDLMALRYVLRAQATGELLRQRDLAHELDISAASVSVLVDRLIRDGYVRRVPFPSDRRSVAIEPTSAGDREVRETLTDMHRRMLETVETLTEVERAAVAKFLNGLIRSVE